MLPAYLIALCVAIVEAKDAYVSIPISFPEPSLASHKYSLTSEACSGTFSTSLAGKPVSIQPQPTATSRNITNHSRSEIPFAPNDDPVKKNPKYSSLKSQPVKAVSTSSSSTIASSSTASASSVTSSSAQPSSTGGPLQSFSFPYTSTFSSITQLMTTLKGKWSWNQAITTVQTVDPSDRSAAGKQGYSGQNNGMAIRAMYPKGSLTPSNKPLGGLNFYAEPIDLSNAYNVSFEYSVFFPEDFDFVLGGKLPGLYGGRSACSGGAAAEDCFSSRMMWRQNGMGELYLYAPRESQTTSLCTTPPLTYCGTADGMSIGRGSFTFQKGAWTHIRQDVWLNTPGLPDGGFNIWVNGQLKISNNQTFFRNTKSKTTSGGGVKAVSRQLLFDSVPNLGFSGDLPALEELEPSPFAAAPTCQANLPMQMLYENGAVKIARPTVTWYRVVTKTARATRVQTSTKLAIVTSTATLSKPSTIYETAYTTSTVLHSDLLNDDRLVKRARIRTIAGTTTTTKQVFVTKTATIQTTQVSRTTTVANYPVTRTTTSTVLTTLSPSSSVVASSSSQPVLSSSSVAQSSSKVPSSSASPSSSAAPKPSASVAVGSDAIRNPNRPWTFEGIMHMTFFGGSADKWRAKKDEYTYFNDWALTINA